MLLNSSSSKFSVPSAVRRIVLVEQELPQVDQGDDHFSNFGQSVDGRMTVGNGRESLQRYDLSHLGHVHSETRSADAKCENLCLICSGFQKNPVIDCRDGLRRTHGFAPDDVAFILFV
jgi:hypothetical protein